MAWPLSQDYNEAIQSPAANFADPDLKRGEAVTNALGLPMPFSGNFADVYEVRGPGGGRWAVKCFTREVAGLRERYTEISRHLRQAKLPFTVDFAYLEQGIRVSGRWYPVLKMQWVEGLTFNQFVSQNLDKPAMLEGLAQIWGRMAKYLRAADAAHCDLQHGNVLLVPGSGANSLAIKLIDYDGMWVPALAGGRSGEVGHPSYQHPQRLREGTYSLEVDRFPMLLIATALRAIKIGGAPLWAKYDNGDNLLFKEADLREPEQSALFEELSQLGDPATTALTTAVRQALDGDMASAPLLEEVTKNARPAATRAAQSPAIPLAAPVEMTGTAVTTVPSAAARDTFSGFDAEAPKLDVPLRRPRRAKVAKGGLPGGVRVWVLGGAGVAALVLLSCAGGAGAVYLSTRGKPSQVAQRSTLPAPTEMARTTTPTTRAAPTVPATVPAVVTPPVNSDPIPPTLPTDPIPPVTTPVVKMAEPRRAVPDEAAVTAAGIEVKEKYKSSYDGVKAAEGMPRKGAMNLLAQTLFQPANRLKDDPATHFFKLREARELFAKAGDLDSSLRAATEMAKQFTVKACDTKAVTLEMMGGPSSPPVFQRPIVLYSLGVADEAAEEDEYELASRLLVLAQANAKKLAVAPLTFAVQKRTTEVAAMREAYKAIQKDVRTLADKPDDPNANLALGKFYALEKGDWDRGLTLLARGSDPKLKALAQADLEIRFEPKPEEDLGDRYAAQAASASGTAKTNLSYRAAYWYTRATTKFPPGGAETLYKKRNTLEKPLPDGRPVVLQALYGTQGNWVDVTMPVRSKIALLQGKGDMVEISAADLNDDPNAAKSKLLAIAYRHRGVVYLHVRGLERVPSGPEQKFTFIPEWYWVGTEDTRPAPDQELVVLCAKMVFGNGSCNPCTPKVQSLVKGATLTAKPSEFGQGTGQNRAAVIVYRLGGKIHLSATSEDESLALGSPAE